jgi:hypothetical protein
VGSDAEAVVKPYGSAVAVHVRSTGTDFILDAPDHSGAIAFTAYDGKKVALLTVGLYPSILYTEGCL